MPELANIVSELPDFAPQCAASATRNATLRPWNGLLRGGKNLWPGSLETTIEGTATDVVEDHFWLLTGSGKVQCLPVPSADWTHVKEGLKIKVTGKSSGQLVGLPFDSVRFSKVEVVKPERAGAAA